jgi:hypothetical protein
MEEIEEFVTQLNDVGKAEKEAQLEAERDRVRAEQWKRLGLSPPPKRPKPDYSYMPEEWRRANGYV